MRGGVAGGGAAVLWVGGWCGLVAVLVGPCLVEVRVSMGVSPYDLKCIRLSVQSSIAVPISVRCAESS